MEIRRAVSGDLPVLNELFSRAKAFMAAKGNPDQWEDGYPHCMLEGDIHKEQLYVCEEDDHIYAAFVMATGDDPTYQVILGGWLNYRPYWAVHRVASRGEEKGAAARCLN